MNEIHIFNHPITLVTSTGIKYVFKVDGKGFIRCNDIPLLTALNRFQRDLSTNHQTIKIQSDTKKPYKEINDFGNIPSKDDLSIPPNTPY